MMEEVNSNIEKTTFGDLSVLSALKEQMEEEAGTKTKSVKAKAPEADAPAEAEGTEQDSAAADTEEGTEA